MKSYTKNIFAGSVLIVFSLVYLYHSLAIQPFTGPGATPLNSAHMPRFWGACMLLLSALLLIRGIRELVKTEKKEKLDLKKALIGFFGNNYPVILTFTALIVYLALLNTAGFLIMSAIYVCGQACILSKKPTGRIVFFSAIAGIISAVLVNYIFVVHLNILLPRGILGF
ncbi:MAG: tripartite tricarboxylate transporter TctB family protein [Treponema sp.]|nr:tripartite tricarboxylate transporter TctB family protein [Treponema sp.]